MRYLAAAALLALGAFPAIAGEQPGLEKLVSYDLTELMNVEVVSASRVREPAREAPATVLVLTAGEIRERGYLTLEEALSGLPGFQFRDIAGFNSYVFMRGAPSQNNLVLVLVDGVQVNELNSGGFYGGAQYNLANVKRIEVVYGPASALYGTNAVSGIINIITNDPEDLRGGGGSALAGSFATRAADFRYGSYDREKRSGFSVSGKLARTDKHGLGGAKGDGNWSGGMENFEEDQAFDGKLVYKDFTLGAAVQEKSASRTTNEVSEGTGFLDFGSNWHIRFANIWLKHLYDRQAGWALESRLYYRNSTVLPDTVSGVYEGNCSTCGQLGQYRPNDLVGFESQVKLKPSESLELTVGAAAERESLARDYSSVYSGDPLVRPEEPGTPAMVSNELLSLYAQGHYHLGPSLALTAGLRHDSSSSYGHVTTPRAGLVYSAGRNTLKLLYAEAFRAPRPWDYTYGTGNPGLDPEKMRSMELSAGRSWSDSLMLYLTFYRNELENLLALSGNRWVNSGEASANGLGARAEFAGGSLKGYLNYSLQVSEDGEGASLAEIARHTAGAGTTYAFGGGVKLNLSARYIGRKKSPQAIAASGGGHVGAAVVTDAALSLGGRGPLTLRLLAKNLFNARYYHTSNRPPDRYRQAPRQLLLQLGWAFGEGGL